MCSKRELGTGICQQQLTRNLLSLDIAHTLAKAPRRGKGTITTTGHNGHYWGGGTWLGAWKPHELAWYRTCRSNKEGRGIFFSFPFVAPVALIIAVSGQMVAIACIPENQGFGQAAHRLLQLFRRCGHQKHRKSQQQGHLRCRPSLLAQVHGYPCRLPRPHRLGRDWQEYHASWMSLTRHHI